MEVSYLLRIVQSFREIQFQYAKWVDERYKNDVKFSNAFLALLRIFTNIPTALFSRTRERRTDGIKIRSLHRSANVRGKWLRFDAPWTCRITRLQSIVEGKGEKRVRFAASIYVARTTTLRPRSMTTWKVGARTNVRGSGSEKKKIEREEEKKKGVRLVWQRAVGVELGTSRADDE